LRNGTVTGFDMAAEPALAYHRGPIARAHRVMPIRFSLLPRYVKVVVP
jgi:hypothetical protein